MHDPNESHMADAHHVLRYLQGTASLGIQFGGPDFSLHGYSDANFTTPSSNGKSVSGYCFFLCGGVISYRSKLQTTVAKSTAEAEYVALGAASAEALYLQQLLQELGISVDKPTIIGEDNQACLSIATTTMTSFRTRHIRVEFHFIRDAIQRGDILDDIQPCRHVHQAFEDIGLHPSSLHDHGAAFPVRFGHFLMVFFSLPLQ